MFTEVASNAPSPGSIPDVCRQTLRRRGVHLSKSAVASMLVTKAASWLRTPRMTPVAVPAAILPHLKSSIAAYNSSASMSSHIHAYTTEALRFALPSFLPEPADPCSDARSRFLGNLPCPCVTQYLVEGPAMLLTRPDNMLHHSSLVCAGRLHPWSASRVHGEGS